MLLRLLHPTSNGGADTAKDFHIVSWILAWEDAGDAMSGVVLSGFGTCRLTVFC